MELYTICLFRARQSLVNRLLARRVEHKILMSCHCDMDGSLPITQIHESTGALEDHMKEKLPQIARATIHPEPAEER